MSALKDLFVPQKLEEPEPTTQKKLEEQARLQASKSQAATSFNSDRRQTDSGLRL